MTNFDPQPVLQGETLVLRPLVEDDLAALFAVAQDPLIWEQHPSTDRHEEAGFAPFFAEAMASGGALAVLADGEVIGTSRFRYDEQRREVEIGWTFLARRWWGGDTNRELKGLMVEHAFRFVDCVVFLVAPSNTRSQRALGKIGAVHAGARLDDAGQSTVLFEIRLAPD